MIKILFICHGNICRSTMCQSVFADMVEQLGIAKQFEIDSAATSREEIGNQPHYGTVRKLRQEGIPLIPHAARQMTRDDYLYYDYLIGMDSENIRNMLRIAGGGDELGKIHKLMEFAEIDSDAKGREAGGRSGRDSAQKARDVADPWYTGDFDATYRDVTEGLRGFLKYLELENRSKV